MKFTWIMSLMLAMSAVTAQAQQLPIRSGDHPTFSRLAIPVPTSQSWEAKQTSQGVVLTLPGFTGSFNTADVFVRMQRNRISGMTANGGVLTLKLVCNCDATAFRSGQLLVIDVADAGTALAAPALQKPLQEPRSRTRATTGIALPWIGGNSPFAVSASDKESAAQTTADPKEASRSDLLMETKNALIKEVASAASAGLLENSYRAPEPSAVTSRNNSESSTLQPQSLPEIIETPTQNMRVTSSLDFPNATSTSRVDATTAGTVCPQSDLLSVHIWGEEGSFSSQIGPARNALMDARDKLDLSAAKKLAQLYIYFGFGAEAHAILRLNPTLEKDHPELAVIAQILEKGAVTGRNTLGQYADCESDIALWASLSFQKVPSDAVIDTNAALRALNKMPKHLRQIIAPALSDRLLQYGDSEAAAAAMRSVERLPDPLTPDGVMAQAELAIDAGEPAEAFLEEVIDTNTTQSPDALVKLVRGKLARDEPLSNETATLVEAYVQELRGTPLGNTLRQTQVIALGQSERFTEAFESLSDLSPSLSPEATTDLTKVLLGQLGKKAGDFQFLEHVFAQSDATIAALPKQTKLLLASRMMDLGFAAQVQQMLETVPDRPRTPARQILAARAALGLRQPFQAQAALIGIDDPQAALLLAQAKEMAGSYREASELFAANDAIEQAAQAAWLSDEWRDLIPDDAPDFGPVTTLVQARPTIDDLDLGPLGRADQALEESRAARSTLEQLLQNPAIQMPPDS
ncbi:hypothetical protein [uncultured Sulfitobacter sp.]|uniref:hypothetical protein n=1 Tax=uncultured Sulfitobacter sp. TaxID=191468 RepID=UPI0026328240|nr:hypothetical protein [uncultured Sulfitobacter sp.]